MDDNGALEQTATILAAYVSNNTISPTDLPAIIASVHKALVTVDKGEPEPEPAKAPAVSKKRSVRPDHVVCLEDGRKFKSLKRHLRTTHDLSAEAYRARWGLARDHPIVAPNYSVARSTLAKQMGLGAGGKKAATPLKAPRRKRAVKAPAS